MLDETEFLSPYGVRALSRVHEQQPYVYRHDGMDLTVRYQPAESDSGLFGGNSNWRGPIWFPVNFLIIESLQKFHHYYGDDFRVACPTGSGNLRRPSTKSRTSWRSRLTRIFLKDEHGRRPVFGHHPRHAGRPAFPRSRPVLRILPRRHRPRRRRLASDRLDRPRREAADAALRTRRRSAFRNPHSSRRSPRWTLRFVTRTCPRQ